MFTILQKYKMKLNPMKCTFGVGWASFLALWFQKGIEANSEKIEAIINMKPLRNLNKV